MGKISAKLASRGDSLAVTIPKDVLEATGLKPGDDLYFTVRDDGVIELRPASTAELALDEAFDWSLERYQQTYRDLAE